MPWSSASSPAHLSPISPTPAPGDAGKLVALPPGLSPKYDKLSPVTRLWLQSRVLQATGGLLARGFPRPLTRRNLGIWSDLVRALTPRLSIVASAEHRHILPRVMLHFLWQVVSGIVPAAR